MPGALWKTGTAIAAPVVMAIDEGHGRLLMATGPKKDTVTFRDARNYRVIKTVRIPGAPNIDGFIVDGATGHLFVLSAGKWSGTGSTVKVSAEGRVTMLALGTGRVLHTATPGVLPAQAVMDPATSHLFVVSAGHLNSAEGWRAHSLVSTIDTRTGAIRRVVRYGPMDIIDLTDLAVNSPQGRLYMTAQDANQAAHAMTNSILVVSTATGKVAATIQLPFARVG